MTQAERTLLLRILLECGGSVQNNTLATADDWDDLADELQRVQRLARVEAERLYYIDQGEKT